MFDFFKSSPPPLSSKGEVVPDSFVNGIQNQIDLLLNSNRPGVTPERIKFVFQLLAKGKQSALLQHFVEVEKNKEIQDLINFISGALNLKNYTQDQIKAAYSKIYPETN